jgi:hypothetical protein
MFFVCINKMIIIIILTIFNVKFIMFCCRPSFQSQLRRHLKMSNFQGHFFQKL